jgi:DHA3 family tetracycline resistance protein-like MFS transporter
MGPLEVLLPFVTQDVFSDGPLTYGLVLAAFGVGTALGAIVVSSRKLPRRYLTVMMLCWAIGTLPIAVLGTTSSFVVMAAAALIVGFTEGIGTVIWGTLLQLRVPREMLGRVSSLDFFVSLAFLPLSMAAAGPLSKVMPVSTIFLVAGVVPVLVALLAIGAARMRQEELAHPLA